MHSGVSDTAAKPGLHKQTCAFSKLLSPFGLKPEHNEFRVNRGTWLVKMYRLTIFLNLANPVNR